MVACAALLLVGCDGQPSASTTTPTSTQPPFPYPPFEVRTETAVPLAQPLAGAAEFAADANVDLSFIYNVAEEERYRNYRSKITPEAGEHIFRIPSPYVGGTGGALQRVVAARDLPDGVIEVTICSFDTPGRYVVTDAGELVASPGEWPVSVHRPHVRWTKEPAADGSTPGEPRWLVTDRGVSGSPEEAAAECDPFKPEPFVHKPPEPTR